MFLLSNLKLLEIDGEDCMMKGFIILALFRNAVGIS